MNQHSILRERIVVDRTGRWFYVPNRRTCEPPPYWLSMARRNGERERRPITDRERGGDVFVDPDNYGLNKLVKAYRHETGQTGR